jgi:hypothetical protein
MTTTAVSAVRAPITNVAAPPLVRSPAPTSADRVVVPAPAADAAAPEPARDAGASAYQPVELTFRIVADRLRIDVRATATKSILRTISLALPGRTPIGTGVDTQA